MPTPRLPSELKPADVVVTCDTREQLPWSLEPLRVERDCLQTGDYGLRDLPDLIRLERKSLADFVACCGRDRPRFQAEIERLRGFPVKAVIVEATWADLEAGEWRSQISPASMLGSTLGWICSGIPFVLAGNREKASQYAARILFITARREWKKLRGLAESITEVNA